MTKTNSDTDTNTNGLLPIGQNQRQARMLNEISSLRPNETVAIPLATFAPVAPFASFGPLAQCGQCGQFG